MNKPINIHSPKYSNPLWSLCITPLSSNQNISEISVFMKQVKPKYIAHIDSHGLFSKLLNLTLIVQINVLDCICNNQSEWTLVQKIFVGFLICKFLYFSQKRQSQLQKSDQMQKNNEKLGLIQSIFEKITSLRQFAGILIFYATYTAIQEYLYLPQNLQFIAFALLIVFDQSSPSNKKDFKMSTLLIYFNTFNFYRIGLFSLMLNTKYDLAFQRPSSNFDISHKELSLVEKVFFISVTLLFLLFEKTSFKWSVFLICLWFFLKIIVTIDKQSVSLKRKYKDQGEMPEIEQYH